MRTRTKLLLLGGWCVGLAAVALGVGSWRRLQLPELPGRYERVR